MWIGLIHVSIAAKEEAQLASILVKCFGLSAFKHWQLKITQATQNGKKTFVVQPTGSGKSLCSVYTGKMMVVLTPTINLMQDQSASLPDTKGSILLSLVAVIKMLQFASAVEKCKTS